MSLGGIMCAATRSHIVDRRREWHDGLNMRTNCARCGKPLIKAPIPGTPIFPAWRLFEAHDANLERRPHPEQGEGAH